MSTAVLEPEVSDSTDYTQYKALSAAAVATLVIGILSLLAFLHPWFVAIPVAGLLVGWYARKTIRANPAEITGDPVAKAGILLCLLFGIAGPSYQGYIYATEVPDWAMRISYAELQPDDQSPGQVLPPSAMELNGKKVFIKGYMYPGKALDGIKQFVLCRDQGDCCFGGKPKITDRIEVTLADPLRISHTSRLVRVAGTFRVEPTQTADGLGAVLYHLDGEYVR